MVARENMSISSSKKGAMLIDEQSDPAEQVNLADKPEHAATRARLSGLLKTLERAPEGR